MLREKDRPPDIVTFYDIRFWCQETERAYSCNLGSRTGPAGRKWLYSSLPIRGESPARGEGMSASCTVGGTSFQWPMHCGGRNDIMW